MEDSGSESDTNPAEDPQEEDSDSDDIDSDSTSMMSIISAHRSYAEIVKICRGCQLNKAEPRRFLFALKDDIMG